MKIAYLGHSSFQLTDHRGTSVVCDPYDSSVGFAMPEVFSDAITVSHHHYDHDYVQAVGGHPVVIDQAGSFEIGGIKISAVKSYHDNVRGKARGENIIFKFLIDGIVVCHMGDLGEDFSESLAEHIQPVNVLLIPVGGNYTIDAPTAKRYVDAIAPDIVIPMHYRSEGCKIDIAGIDEFLAFYDNAKIRAIGGSKIELSDNEFPKKTEIVVLRRKTNGE